MSLFVRDICPFANPSDVIKRLSLDEVPIGKDPDSL